MRIDCESIGINLHEMCLSEGTSLQELLEHISSFNDNPSINGIITGTPLPSHMNEEEVLNAICTEKDVEGSNFLNISRLVMKDRQPLFVPCVPKGCIELLHKYGVAIKGKRAVVTGRGTVGMPTALLLQREDATVTVVHSRTRNPEEITRETDILICAVGQPNIVRGSWIKLGDIVIEVGSNVFELDEEDPLNFETAGDGCYEETSKIASAIASTYLDVEEMARTMLLSDVLDAAKRAHNFE